MNEVYWSKPWNNYHELGSARVTFIALHFETDNELLSTSDPHLNLWSFMDALHQNASLDKHVEFHNTEIKSLKTDCFTNSIIEMKQTVLKSVVVYKDVLIFLFIK